MTQADVDSLLETIDELQAHASLADGWMPRALHRAERECDALRRWQYEVADGVGYLNRADGQSGYEVASAATIVQAFKQMERRGDAAEYERDEARAEVERLRDGFAIMASSLEARARQADDARAEVERLTRIDVALAQGGDYVRQLVASYRTSALGAQTLEKIATSKLFEMRDQAEDLRRDLASRDREVLDLRAQLDEATMTARKR